jgi:hypothetical protein
MNRSIGDLMAPSRSCLLALAVIGCSNAGAGPTAPNAARPGPAAQLYLVNATAQPFAFFVFAADLAPLLDPVPEVRVGAPGTQLVLAGAEYVLGEIPGRSEAPDGGIAVFLYALTPDGSRAHFTRVHLVTGAEIRQADGRIVVRRVQ